MGLLKSVDNEPGIDFHEYRDNLYYNKYGFRMRVNIPCVKYAWWCHTESELDDKIAGKTKRYNSIKKSEMQTVVDNQDAIKTVIRYQISRKQDKNLGIRIEGTTTAFFSNDLTVLQGIAKEIGSNYTFDFTQVQTSQYAGIKHFVEQPKHKYRVYLRSKRIEDGFVDELKETLDRQRGLKLSNAFREWLVSSKNRRGLWHYRWTNASHFIDYDDESTLSYLALMHGEVLGKKYKLEKRPEQV